MIIKSIRNLPELIEVLRDPSSKGPETAYWVFSDLGHKQWENMTVTSPGDYNGEFPKTYGHYHTNSNEKEIYHLVSGHGIFQLQRKHVVDGNIVPNRVDEVFLVGAEAGDEIAVPTDYGHSWSNLGNTPLITFDNWRFGHDPNDYEPIKQQHGMAYYIVKDGKSLKIVPNPNYEKLPDAKWVTAKEFKKLFD